MERSRSHREFFLSVGRTPGYELGWAHVYDTKPCHDVMAMRKADAIIPTRKNGKPWKTNRTGAAACNEILRATRRLEAVMNLKRIGNSVTEHEANNSDVGWALRMFFLV